MIDMVAVADIGLQGGGYPKTKANIPGMHTPPSRFIAWLLKFGTETSWHGIFREKFSSGFSIYNVPIPEDYLEIISGRSSRPISWILTPPFFEGASAPWEGFALKTL